MYQIVSPNPEDDGVWIHQNAWFHLGDFTEKTTLGYKLKNEENGVYVFIISGDAVAEERRLKRRDGFGITGLSEIKITASQNSRILLIEVPMEV